MKKSVRADVIQVMVTKEMKEKVREIADKKYVSMSTLVLQFISQGIESYEKSNELLSADTLSKVAAGFDFAAIAKK